MKFLQLGGALLTNRQTENLKNVNRIPRKINNKHPILKNLESLSLFIVA